MVLMGSLPDPGKATTSSHPHWSSHTGQLLAFKPPGLDTKARGFGCASRCLGLPAGKARNVGSHEARTGYRFSRPAPRIRAAARSGRSAARLGLGVCRVAGLSDGLDLCDRDRNGSSRGRDANTVVLEPIL